MPANSRGAPLASSSNGCLWRAGQSIKGSADHVAVELAKGNLGGRSGTFTPLPCAAARLCPFRIADFARVSFRLESDGCLPSGACRAVMLATVTKFLDPWEAYVFRARLEGDGIPATVAFANHAVANWPMSLALGGTAVQVPVGFLAQSRNILADYHAGTLESELNDALGTPEEHCSRCGSTDFAHTMPWRERLYAIVVILVFAPFPTYRSRRVCRSCGHQWDAGES